MRRLAILAGGLALLAGGVAWGAEPVGEFFKNERWGYRCRAPKGWTSVAMSATESWIASKHISPRRLSPKKVQSWSEAPEMWIIGFPHGREEGAKVEEKDGVSVVTVKNPYKDYKEFVKKEGWFTGGGYYFSKEEEAEIDGVKVTQYEIKVEKMVDAPSRIVAWQYHAEDVDFAVQFKIYEDYWEDYSQTFTACLRSFKRIPRKTAMPGGQTTGEDITRVEDESKLTPEEKAKRREQKVEQTLAREIENLPKDWISMRSAHYVALSHCDEKFTKETLDFAESIRGYLDETFAVGSDYVPPGIIRIFQNQDEESGFRGGTGWGWLFGGAEQVTLAKRLGEEKGWEYQYLAKKITEQWITFRNTLLDDNMPFWIHEGLRQHMGFARPKGKRIEFKPDPYDQEQLREVVRKGNAIPLKDLVQGDTEKFKEWAHRLQAGSVVSWLLTEGGKGKCKGAVQAYLGALIGAVEEEEKAYKAKRDEQLKKTEGELEKNRSGEDDSARSDADDEEAEDKDEAAFEKAMKAWREALKEKEKAIKERAFQAAFGKLTDADWTKLDAAWQKFGG